MNERTNKRESSRREFLWRRGGAALHLPASELDSYLPGG